MCKHITNAQVSVRAPCCRRWFDCPDCHAESTDHPLRRTMEMVFACKSCRRTFRKDMHDYQPEDEFCPHCDNHYVIPAETKTADRPSGVDEAILSSRMMDDRLRQLTEDELLDLINDGDVSSKLG